MKQVWFTGDLHLGNESVAAERGFSSARKHDAYLDHAWRQCVDDEDVVYVVGNIARPAFRRSDSSLDLFVGLPGIKRLILGPCDSGHPSHPGTFLPAVAEWLSGSVEWHGTLAMVDQMMVCHFAYDPLSLDHHDAFGSWRPVDRGRTLIHAEGRTKKRSSLSSLGSMQVNVGVEAWKGGPVHRDDVLDIASGRIREGQVAPAAFLD